MTASSKGIDNSQLNKNIPSHVLGSTSEIYNENYDQLINRDITPMQGGIALIAQNSSDEVTQFNHNDLMTKTDGTKTKHCSKVLSSAVPSGVQSRDRTMIEQASPELD